MSALVYVVEADAASKSGIGGLLEARGYETVAYGSAAEILERMPDCDRAGCIVLNVRARDASASELFDRLVKAGSTLPVIVLSGQSDVRAGVRAIKAGVEDFFTLPVEREEFITAIDRAIARHRLAAARESSERLLMARLERLTRRERQVFELVHRGRLNKQVAFELGMTERTVKAHRRQVMEKLQLRSVVELVSFADRLGLSADPV